MRHVTRLDARHRTHFLWRAALQLCYPEGSNSRAHRLARHACVPLADLDHDGIPDHLDNCPGIYNPLQLDTNHDGRGDACDPDDTATPSNIDLFA